MLSEGYNGNCSVILIELNYEKETDMNAQYKNVVKAFESAHGSYGKAIGLLRDVVGHVDGNDVKNAKAQEANWQDFLTSDEYKAADTSAQDLMRKSMQRIRAKCGYSCDRAGKITVKKTVARGTKSRDAGVEAPKEMQAHSVANPKEAAKIVESIVEWKTALGALIDVFGDTIPAEILSTLRGALFGVTTKSKQKA